MFLKKTISLFIAITFLTSSVYPNYARAELILPAPSQFVPLSNTYSFPVLKGMKFDPVDPLKMEFIIDTADQKDLSEEEASRLIKYFLAGLTIPEEDTWVNMSPYEADKIIPQSLSQTDLGKDLLSQDYILKQLSSSLTYPESDTGKDFWARTYQEVLKVAKTTKLPVNTFNKIWIMPDKAVVYEHDNFAMVSQATLKTMLEEDYLALKNNLSSIQKQKKMREGLINQVNEASSKVMRETILPKINADVNSGKNFATLRQIYYSLILGVWFKKKFKDSLYKAYINQGKVKGIDLADKGAKDKIYNLYVEAFKKGIYNYIKPEKDLGTGRNIKRQYFSGGFTALNIASSAIINKAGSNREVIRASNISGLAKGIEIRLLNPSGAVHTERSRSASPLNQKEWDKLVISLKEYGTKFKKIDGFKEGDIVLLEKDYNLATWGVALKGLYKVRKPSFFNELELLRQGPSNYKGVIQAGLLSRDLPNDFECYLIPTAASPVELWEMSQGIGGQLTQVFELAEKAIEFDHSVQGVLSDASRRIREQLKKNIQAAITIVVNKKYQIMGNRLPKDIKSREAFIDWLGKGETVEITLEDKGSEEKRGILKAVYDYLLEAAVGSTAASPVTLSELLEKSRYTDGMGAIKQLVRIAKIYGGSITPEIRDRFITMTTAVNDELRALAREALKVLQDPNNYMKMPLDYWLTDSALFEEVKKQKDSRALRDLLYRIKRDADSFYKDGEIYGWLAAKTTAVNDEIRKLANEAMDAFHTAEDKHAAAERASTELKESERVLSDSEGPNASSPLHPDVIKVFVETMLRETDKKKTADAKERLIRDVDLDGLNKVLLDYHVLLLFGRWPVTGEQISDKFKENLEKMIAIIESLKREKFGESETDTKSPSPKPLTEEQQKLVFLLFGVLGSYNDEKGDLIRFVDSNYPEEFNNLKATDAFLLKWAIGYYGDFFPKLNPEDAKYRYSSVLSKADDKARAYYANVIILLNFILNAKAESVTDTNSSAASLVKILAELQKDKNRFESSDYDLVRRINNGKAQVVIYEVISYADPAEIPIIYLANGQITGSYNKISVSEKEGIIYASYYDPLRKEGGAKQLLSMSFDRFARSKKPSSLIIQVHDTDRHFIVKLEDTATAASPLSNSNLLNNKAERLKEVEFLIWRLRNLQYSDDHQDRANLISRLGMVAISSDEGVLSLVEDYVQHGTSPGIRDAAKKALDMVTSNTAYCDAEDKRLTRVKGIVSDLKAGSYDTYMDAANMIYILADIGLPTDDDVLSILQDKIGSGVAPGVREAATKALEIIKNKSTKAASEIWGVSISGPAASSPVTLFNLSEEQFASVWALAIKTALGEKSLLVNNKRLLTLHFPLSEIGINSGIGLCDLIQDKFGISYSNASRIENSLAYAFQVYKGMIEQGETDKLDALILSAAELGSVAAAYTLIERADNGDASAEKMLKELKPWAIKANANPDLDDDAAILLTELANRGNLTAQKITKEVESAGSSPLSIDEARNILESLSRRNFGGGLLLISIGFVSGDDWITFKEMEVEGFYKKGKSFGIATGEVKDGIKYLEACLTGFKIIKAPEQLINAVAQKIAKLKQSAAAPEDSPVTNAESEIDPSLRGLNLRTDNSEAGTPYGGIDLGDIDVEARGQSPAGTVPFAAIDLANFQGFTFRIIKIEPITNFNAIFGATFMKVEGKASKENLQLAYAK